MKIKEVCKEWDLYKKELKDTSSLLFYQSPGHTQWGSPNKGNNARKKKNNKEKESKMETKERMKLTRKHKKGGKDGNKKKERK